MGTKEAESSTGRVLAAPCYSLFSFGTCFETYEPFISFIFLFLAGGGATVNCRFWVSISRGTTVYLYVILCSNKNPVRARRTQKMQVAKIGNMVKTYPN